MGTEDHVCNTDLVLELGHHDAVAKKQLQLTNHQQQISLLWFGLDQSSPTDHEALETSLTLGLTAKNLAINKHKEADHEQGQVVLVGQSSSHESTVSSFSNAHLDITSIKRERDVYVVGSDHEFDDQMMEMVSLKLVGDEDDELGSAKKKLRLNKEQSALLEGRFKEHTTLNPKQKKALAVQLNLRPRQVEVWFQNRRARTKLKQTEVECEYLKRCCEALRQENRRLQQEVHELKGLKLASPFYNMPVQAAATTLTMCPSCERIGSGSTNSSKGPIFRMQPLKSLHLNSPFSSHKF